MTLSSKSAWNTSTDNTGGEAWFPEALWLKLTTKCHPTTNLDHTGEIWFPVALWLKLTTKCHPTTNLDHKGEICFPEALRLKLTTEGSGLPITWALQPIKRSQAIFPFKNTWRAATLFSPQNWRIAKEQTPGGSWIKPSKSLIFWYQLWSSEANYNHFNAGSD